MEAIILAGGFGTRLAHIVSDVPKPMAHVAGYPFLHYIVNDLIKKGITRIVFAVGYKKECIMGYFGELYNGCEIVYSIEETPLFTGGAIKKALAVCKGEHIFVINGDTFFDVNFEEMLGQHLVNNAELTIATKMMKDIERYGTVQVEDEKIVGFVEKKKLSEGEINGGIYIIQKERLASIQAEKFSFEIDFMEKEVVNKQILRYLSNGYFIDIGIEVDYFKAQDDFK